MDKERINQLIGDIDYFWNERSLERYVGLEEALEKIPGLKERYSAYKIAQENLGMFIEKLELTLNKI